MTALSNEHYRRLWEDLRACVAERVRAERELAALDEDGGDPSFYELEQRLHAHSQEFERSRAIIEERHAAEQSAAEERFQQAGAEAEARYNSAVAQARRRCDEALAKVESEYEENRWLMSSILDDQSASSPKRQYETLKSQLEQTRERLAIQWDELQLLHGEAKALVERRRQSGGDGPVAPAAPQTREQALQKFETAAAAVREHYGQLKAQVVPQLFAGGGFVLAGLLLWGGLFAAAFLLIDPQAIGMGNLGRVGWLLATGGAGFAVCTIVMLVLHTIAARQTAAAFAPLRQGMADAQVGFQQWQRFAREELQRRERDYTTRYAAIAEHRETSLQKFADAREERVAQAEAARDQELQKAWEQHNHALRVAAEQRNAELLKAEAAHRRDSLALQRRFEEDREQLTQEHNRRTGERDAHRSAIRERVTSVWTEGLRRVRAASETAARAAESLSPTWESILEPDWTLPEEIPAGVAIGEYELDLQRIPDGLPADPQLVPESPVFAMPAVLPFPEAPSLVLHARGAGRGAAVAILQTAMLRLLTQLPPGKVRFTVIDPVGLGENFAAFMHLADFDDLLISNRIWTETAHIEQQLGNLTEHMENVFQKYLRNEFETIEEYNVHAGEVAEPYRILVVANFPAAFSERAAQRLASIAQCGARCGVYTLVSVDAQQPLPRGFDLANLETGATRLQWQDGRFVTFLFDPDAIPLRPDAPPPPPQFAAIVRRIGELSKDVRRVEVPFRRIAPSEEAWWTSDSRKLLDCPLGRAGATKIQHMRLGVGTSQHVLVAGKTGSGKSTLLHVLIINLALRYSPDEVEFYLIDFKKGVEFKTYASHGLPHARVIAIESDREFGTSALQRLDAVLKERGDLFRQAGVQDIEAYRDARPEARLPRILLVVDEFQEFFVEDDRDSQTASLLLDRLVRQGRAFGIHVLLGSQTLGGAYSLARTTIGQMAVRVALQCSETDAHLILSEENSAARLLTRPGEAIYNDANGMLEGNSPFQIAWLDDDQQDEFLNRIADMARRRGLPPASPVVFEGNIPADPSRNAALAERLDAESVAANNGQIHSTAWLGEAVAITGPTAVTFHRQAGANLLIVGQDASAAMGMLGNCLLALAAGVPRDAEPAAESPPPITLLAGSPSDPARTARWQRVVAAAPHAARLVAPDDAAGAVAALAAEIARRLEHAHPRPPLFLLIDELSRFRDLRKGEDDFGFGGFGREKTVSPAQQFAEVLREGPAVGVHTLAWCDSYNNVDRWLGRQLLREFEMRVVLQMSSADSSNLIDSPAASRLGTNRALLYLDDRGTAEKFRPYGPPSEAWLDRVRACFRGSDDAADDVADDIGMWVVT